MNLKQYLNWTFITLEELGIQYSQASAKPQRETNSHNRLLEALTSKANRIAFCSPVSLSLHWIRGIETNSTTILVHRTTVHIWRWFQGMVFLILTRNYSQVLAKPEWQTISHNCLFIETFSFSRLSATRIKTVCPPSPPQAYRNIHSITISVHRTTTHIWKWFRGLMSKQKSDVRGPYVAKSANKQTNKQK